MIIEVDDDGTRVVALIVVIDRSLIIAS